MMRGLSVVATSASASSNCPANGSSDAASRRRETGEHVAMHLRGDVRSSSA